MLIRNYKSVIVITLFLLFVEKTDTLYIRLLINTNNRITKKIPIILTVKGIQYISPQFQIA